VQRSGVRGAGAWEVGVNSAANCNSLSSYITECHLNNSAALLVYFVKTKTKNTQRAAEREREREKKTL